MEIVLQKEVKVVVGRRFTKWLRRRLVAPVSVVDNP